MPSPKREPITTNGRPIKDVNWDEVDELLEGGCMGTEIASIFGMHPNTLYERTIREKGMGFSEYSSEKKPKGEGLIRMKQYKKAIEGDTAMLIWLGKNRLSQRETTEISVSPEAVKGLTTFMDQLKQYQNARNPTTPPPETTTDEKNFKSDFN